MKQLLLSVLLFSAIFSYGQTKQGHSSTPPTYFLDSVRQVKLPQFDPDKISSVDVVKEYDEVAKTSGRIYIKTKDPKSFNFLSLEQIAKQNAVNAAPCLYMINSELVKDISNVKIDSSYILKCEVVNSKELKYFQGGPSFIILNIKTKTKENLEKENKIYIRGSETALSYNQIFSSN